VKNSNILDGLFHTLISSQINKTLKIEKVVYSNYSKKINIYNHEKENLEIQWIKGHIMKANLSWSRTRAKIYQLISSLSVILLQLKLTKFKLEVFKSNFQGKKKDMNTDKLAIKWQNFVRVRLQLKFAFIIPP